MVNTADAGRRHDHIGRPLLGVERPHRRTIAEVELGRRPHDDLRMASGLQSAHDG